METIIIYIPTDNGTSVIVEFEIGNDGIGSWECHGKGFDRGTDYVSVHDWQVDKAAAQDEREEAEAWLDSHPSEVQALVEDKIWGGTAW